MNLASPIDVCGCRQESQDDRRSGSFVGVLLAGHGRLNIGTQRHSSLSGGLLLAVVIGDRLPWRDQSRTTVGAHCEDHQALGCFGQDTVLHVPRSDDHQDVHAAAGVDQLCGGFTRSPTLTGRENLTLPTYAVTL